jgi:hypothetical protein
MWKNMGPNSDWNVGIDDTMVVDIIVMTTCMSPFLKPLLDFDSMPKKFHPHKHAFLQMLFVHFYMRRFHFQSDCGQTYPIQQIIIQICITCIFHDPICNLIKGAITY